MHVNHHDGYTLSELQLFHADIHICPHGLIFPDVWVGGWFFFKFKVVGSPAEAKGEWRQSTCCSLAWELSSLESFVGCSWRPYLSPSGHVLVGSRDQASSQTAELDRYLVRVPGVFGILSGFYGCFSGRDDGLYPVVFPHRRTWIKSLRNCIVWNSEFRGIPRNFGNSEFRGISSFSLCIF